MSDTYQALLIKDGKIKPLALRREGSGATHAAELIGGAMCQCFRVRSHSPGRTLVGYCDDEFLYKDLPVNVVLTSDLYRTAPPGYPVCGPIVVCAHDGPDTVSMTAKEMNAFVLVGPLLHYVRPQ